MAEFTINIAGHCGRVTSLFESTKDYCGKYLTEDPAEVHKTVTREDLIFEQAQLDEEAKLEGFTLIRDKRSYKTAETGASYGPYRVAEVTLDGILLERNPAWWGEPGQYDQILCR